MAHPKSVAGVCNINQPLHAPIDPEVMEMFGLISSEDEFLDLAKQMFDVLYGPLPQEEKERYDALLSLLFFYFISAFVCLFVCFILVFCFVFFVLSDY